MKGTIYKVPEMLGHSQFWEAIAISEYKLLKHLTFFLLEAPVLNTLVTYI